MKPRDPPAIFSAYSSWRGLATAQTVTPRLSEGFTVYDAKGQWMNPQTQSIGQQKTKVIVVATAHTPPFRARSEELTAAYRERFYQQ
jgi:hypothetical protein